MDEVEIRKGLRAMSDEQLRQEYVNATREGKAFDTVALWIRFAAERELKRRKLDAWLMGERKFAS